MKDIFNFTVEGIGADDYILTEQCLGLEMQLIS